MKNSNDNLKATLKWEGKVMKEARFVWLMALVLGVATVAGPEALAQEKSRPRQKLTIATAGTALHWYPAYVADAAGLFAAEGLDVEWIDVGAGSKQVAAVAGGGAAMTAVGMQPAITATQHGGNLVAFAALFDKYPLQLVLTNEALKKAGITPAMAIDEKVKRLKDLTVAITGVGSSTDTILRSWLLARNLDPDKMLRIQPMGSPPAMMAAFEKKMIDGFVLSAPFPEIAEARGIGRTVIDPLTEDIPELKDVPYTGMITTWEMIKKNPDFIMAATRALTKAIRFGEERPKQAHELLKKFFPKVEPRLYDRFEPTYRAAAAKSPVITRDQFDRLISWMKITSDKPITVKYDDVIVVQFAEKAAAEILKR
jgi:NitT/TauT family transport system substrate-binding protein